MKTTTQKARNARLFLGIDGGGTRTVALLSDEHGRAWRRLEFGPANTKLLTHAQLIARFRTIARAFPKPSAVGIGVAGIWIESEARQVREAAARAWPDVPCHASNDLEIALETAKMKNEKGSGKGNKRTTDRDSSLPQILILSGTGSCCFGKDARGHIVKMGGWGHLLGDNGSGYEIGLHALKAVVYAYDHDGKWPRLGQQLLRALQLNEPTEFIDWIHSAAKTDIAALATEVFDAGQRGDTIASQILAAAATTLAQDALRCADRLAPRNRPVQFVLAGGILLKQPHFAREVTRRLRQLRPDCQVTPLPRESVWGAIEFAKRLAAVDPSAASQREPRAKREAGRVLPPIQSRRMSPTEQRNPRTMNLDQLPLAAALKLMWAEDARISRALQAVRRPTARAIGAVVRAFRRGGRLFYVGAGTSGRLGVLDASECPVTFSTPPDLVQAILSGGQAALWQSAELAEDDAEAGRRAITFRGVSARDVVVGIAASGTTPFVWGALAEARRRRATTVLIAFNPFLKIPRARRPDICITPNVGPEVLTGSTRLKAGTATKLILNALTTLAMVRLGKVVSNLMVDVVPANAKLRDRAVRIVKELTGADQPTALAALEQCRWNVKKAAARLSG